MNISPSRVALVTGGTKNIGLAIVKDYFLINTESHLLGLPHNP